MKLDGKYFFNVFEPFRDREKITCIFSFIFFYLPYLPELIGYFFDIYLLRGKLNFVLKLG